MKCERQYCGAKPTGDDVFDACAQCGKTLCPFHMSEGCCAHEPATPETVARACGTLGRLRAKHLVKRPAILMHYALAGKGYEDIGYDLYCIGCTPIDEEDGMAFQYMDIVEAAEWWQQREIDLGNAMPCDFEEDPEMCACDGCGKKL